MKNVIKVGIGAIREVKEEDNLPEHIYSPSEKFIRAYLERRKSWTL